MSFSQPEVENLSFLQTFPATDKRTLTGSELESGSDFRKEGTSKPEVI
jgi:hypothetical protein